MARQLIINESTVKSTSGDQLHINLHRRKVNAKLGAYKFLDKDTKQYIIYLPALEISSNGETPKKAEEMIDTVLKDCFDFLLSMKQDGLDAYLRQLRWEKGMFNKDFSRAIIDSNGELQNFNAEENTIKRITLTAA